MSDFCLILDTEVGHLNDIAEFCTGHLKREFFQEELTQLKETTKRHYK